MEITTTDVALLHQKLDYLTEQMQQQQRQIQVLQELKEDMLPIANSLVRVSIEQLEDIGENFQIEDVLYLLKRAMRNLPLLMRSFDRLEAVMDLVDEAEFLGKQVFNDVIEQLDGMEKAGYFALAQSGAEVADQVVRELNAEDVKALGGLLVPVVHAMRQVPDDKDASIFALLRQLSDPAVRKGMVRTLNILKVIGSQPG